MSKMTRLFLVGFALLLSLNPAFASGQWDWQFPKPQGNTLNDVSMPDAQTAYAVGAYGLIMKSTDGGNSWTKLQSPTDITLNGVLFLNASTGWIVGQYGEDYYSVIYRTDDGGQSWTEQTPTEVSDIQYSIFNDVQFIDDQHGWVCGSSNALITTSDGGASWNYLSVTDQYLEFDDVDFIDANTGWITGEGSVFSTTDGGQNWTETTQYTGPGMIQFLSADIGWGVSGENPVKTEDGGSTWTSMDIGLYSDLLDLCFQDENTGVVVGAEGKVYSTTDGGQSWQDESIDQELSLFGVDFGSADDGIFVGLDGFIYSTTDGGQSWSDQRNDPVWNLNDICFIDDNSGFAVGENTSFYGILVKTTDGGENWSVAGTGNDWSEVWKIGFADSQHGWIVGSYNGDHGMILGTNDGGNTWTPQVTADEDYPILYSLSFTDANNVWASGRGGDVYHSTNGGQTWNLQTTIDLPGYSGVYINFVTDQIGYASSYYELYKTTDGGDNWTELSTEYYFTDMSFLDAQTGWAASHNGDIMYTSDGGANWSNQEVSASYLSDILFLDENNGYACGLSEDATSSHAHAAVFHTSDGGVTWTQDHSADFYEFDGYQGLAATDAQNVWVAGNDAILHKTVSSTGIADNSSHQLPEKFQLKQNYPNPFNPGTTIEYSIPHSSNVQVAVFDLRGHRIKTLASGIQTAGNHSVQWNGTNANGESASAGVYFYRVRYNNHSVNRKMVLLK